MFSLFFEKFSSKFILPLLFVLLYGSGFVGAKLGLPDSEPFTFLALRFSLASFLMALIALFLNAPWPSRIKDFFHISISGFLGVGVFSAAAFSSIYFGVSPAVCALVVSLNPIFVSLLAGPLLGERTNYRQFLGLVLGFVGVYFVLIDNFGLENIFSLKIFLSVFALLGLTSGNLYQKKYCSTMNIFTGGAIQCFICTLFMILGILIFDESPVNWTTNFLFAWLWMSIVVSIGAISVFYTMLRRAEISRVSSVFFLMPVSAAVLSYFLFNQSLSFLSVIGVFITLTGVFFAMRNR